MAKTVKSVGRIDVKNPSEKKSVRMAEGSVKSHRRSFFAKALKVSSVAPIVGVPMFSIASSPVVLKMQGAWGAKDIMNEFALEYVDRVNKMAEGRLRIDYLTAGAVVKPFEITDAVSKGVLDAGLFTETSEINIDWLPYSNPETIIAVIPGKKKTK